jgi:TatD DNase family protein
MVIGNARKAEVKQFICPGVDLLSSKQTIELTKKYPGIIYAAIGYHPYEAQQNPTVSELEKLINDSVVAIGEIGLDYHQYKGEHAEGKKQNQKLLFEEQLRLALNHNLPVIMHCRDAFEDFFTVLDALPTLPRGVIHCFSGGMQELRLARERNLLVGLDGNMTYDKHLQTITPQIPLSMLLLETDSPYLTPIPHRGTRNEPKYIPTIAKCIADFQRAEVSEIEDQTTGNARGLFRMI